MQVRETFESAILLGATALDKLGTSVGQITDITARIRERDQQRLELELVSGMDAGKAFFSGKRAQPDAPASSEAPTK